MKKIIFYTFFPLIIACQKKEVSVETILTNDSVQTWQMFRNGLPENGENEYFSYYSFGKDSSLLKNSKLYGNPRALQLNRLDWIVVYKQGFAFFKQLPKSY